MNSNDFGIKKMPEYLKLVDYQLKQLLPRNIRGLPRLLHAHGKRYRPSIVIAIAFYGGKSIDHKVIEAAAAVELVHLASLIHDDIIDGGNLRWGVPTINSKEGVNSAILAGDYLLSKGCALACQISPAAGELLAETIAQLCIGQAEELNNRFNQKRSQASLMTSIKGKTSSLFVAACMLGGLVSGLDSSQLKALSGFGENYGIAYQHIDDVNDFFQSAELTGKSIGNDIREGTYTLPIILSLKGQNKLTLGRLLKTNAPVPLVLDILQTDGSIDQTLKVARKFSQKANLELKDLGNDELAKALSSTLKLKALGLNT